MAIIVILLDNKVYNISVSICASLLFIIPAEEKRPEIIPTRNSEAKRHHKREGIGELTDRWN
jgi:hypothetical protein